MSESDTMFNEQDWRCAAVQLMLSTYPKYDNSTIASILKMQIWIATDNWDVPRVLKTKFPATVMVFGVVPSEDQYWNTCTRLWLTESEQVTPVVSIKDVVRSSVKVPEFDKHQKKAGGYIGRNVVEITIKMKTKVRKPLMIKIMKLRLRTLDN